MRDFKRLFYPIIFALLSSHALYAWESLRPGIDYKKETIAGPRVTYVTRIDLTSPHIKTRASKNEPTESHVTTREFGLDFRNMIVAVNGDWVHLSDSSRAGQPLGLAIGEGVLWNRHRLPNEQNWSFVGCDVTGKCYAGHKPNRETFEPQLNPWRLYQAVGSNEAVLMRNGEVRNNSGHPIFDTRAPRTAICIDQAKTTMWLAVIDGRSNASIGMTWNETANFMQGLGCFDAAMQDGGGSSTMWIKDRGIVNVPSDGSPRSLVNHFGIVYQPELDPECQVDGNKRWCEGTVVHTCAGGKHSITLDCATLGAQCEMDGEYAYCVDPACPAGLGQSKGCLDATHVRSCIDGQIRDSACGDGLVCGGNAPASSCTIPACQPVGSNGAWCEGNMLKTCQNDQYTEQNCEAVGQICLNNTCQPRPIDPLCQGGVPDGDWCNGNLHEFCRGGVFSQENCESMGLICQNNACVMPSMEMGGTQDAGIQDAHIQDASIQDTGIQDAGGTQAGGTQAGGTQAGGTPSNPACANVSNLSWCNGDFLQVCAQGMFSQVNCASQGQICQNNACIATEKEDDNEVVTNPDPTNSLGLMPRGKDINFKVAGESSCQQQALKNHLMLLFALIAILFLRNTKKIS